MAIEYKTGNMFESKATHLVNPVNVRGVMGGGLAKEFKSISPSMYNRYRKECLQGTFKVGDIQVLDMSRGKGTLYAVNFPTKDHWKEPSQLEYIEKGLQTFARDYRKLGINHIAFPKLGSGLGGLDWEEVKPLMVRYLGMLEDITIEIYE